MALTKSDILNYRGNLYIVGQNSTPFLSMIGGLNGGRRSLSFEFPTSVEGSTDAASQDTQSEDTASTAGTPNTYTKTPKNNTAQIMKHDAAVTFKKAATSFGQYGGLNINDDGSSPDSLTFQKNLGLLQIAKNLDFSFIQGSYVQPATTAANAKTRGIIEATLTNAIAAGGAVLTKVIFDSLLKEMFDNGAIFQNVVALVGSGLKVALSNIYGYAPTDRNVGGIDIQQIETDFGVIGVALEPNMPSTTLQLVEVSVTVPVFIPIVFDGDSEPQVDPVNGSDVLWVKTSTVAASFGGFYYTMVGLDYGPETYHGKITGLA